MSWAHARRRKVVGGAKIVPHVSCEGLRCAAPSLVVATQVSYMRQQRCFVSTGDVAQSRPAKMLRLGLLLAQVGRTYGSLL
jgi:hypothetical protein